MMGKIKTYLDTNVLIAAFRGQREIREKAMAIIDDDQREFLYSIFLKLELLAKPTYECGNEELEFMNIFLDHAQEIDIYKKCEDFFNTTLKLACEYGLSAMDALHVNAAIMGGAEEFVTAEKKEKPMFRVKEIKMISIREN